MHDYRAKRHYRQQKLERSGFYHQRRQQSRERLQIEQRRANGVMPSFWEIFSAENLIGAYDKLERNAGHAPGPDGISYDKLGRREVCQNMRQLSQEVVNGRFDPSLARCVKIPKANGCGHRTLKLRSIVYRVVATAVADALGPYFEQLFLTGSHGFRNKRGTQTMLLEMERIIVEQQRFVIAQDDIRNAFDHLPVDYAMQLLGKYVDDEKLLVVIKKILRGHRTENRTVGIDQGSSISPLMLNVVLHHGLDVPFSQNAVHPPWLRYADNVVYLCQSVHEGTTATQAAQALLIPLGMSLKGEQGQPVDLLKGERANILGFNIRWDNCQLIYELARDAWTNLEVMLSSAHTHASPEAALQVVKGWMDSYGPAFEGKSETPILNRVLEEAGAAGHRELPRYQLKRFLQSSRDKWAKRRQHARSAHKFPRELLQDQRIEAAPLATDRSGHLAMPEAEAPQLLAVATSAHLTGRSGGRSGHSGH